VVAEALPLAVEHPFVVEAILLPTVAEDLTSTMMLLLPKSLFVNFVVVLATLLLDATKGWNLSNLPTHISNHSKPTSNSSPALPIEENWYTDTRATHHVTSEHQHLNLSSEDYTGQDKFV